MTGWGFKYETSFFIDYISNFFYSNGLIIRLTYYYHMNPNQLNRRAWPQPTSKTFTTYLSAKSTSPNSTVKDKTRTYHSRTCSSESRMRSWRKSWKVSTLNLRMKWSRRSSRGVGSQEISRRMWKICSWKMPISRVIFTRRRHTSIKESWWCWRKGRNRRKWDNGGPTLWRKKMLN